MDIREVEKERQLTKISGISKDYQEPILLYDIKNFIVYESKKIININNCKEQSFKKENK